jgi:hypothetical protein
MELGYCMIGNSPQLCRDIRRVAILALLGAVMQVNNLQITNLSINWAAQTVTFDIS